jgi:hypothetical protein
MKEEDVMSIDAISTSSDQGSVDISEQMSVAEDSDAQVCEGAELGVDSADCDVESSEEVSEASESKAAEAAVEEDSQARADSEQLDKEVIKSEDRAQISVSKTPPPNVSFTKKPAAVLDVGDRRAKGFNSAPVVAASRGKIGPEAVYRVAARPVRQVERSHSPFGSTRSFFSSSSLLAPEEFELYSSEGAYTFRSSTISEYGQMHETSPRFTSVEDDFETQPAAPAPQFRHLRLLVSDVHRNSCILIKDSDGNVVKRIPLEKGSSELYVSLPNGDYQVVASSGVVGKGDGKKADKYDNFRVEVYEATDSKQAPAEDSAKLADDSTDKAEKSEDVESVSAEA